MSPTRSKTALGCRLPVLLSWCGLSLAAGIEAHSAWAEAPVNTLRTHASFNLGWHFSLGDHPGGASENFDDSSWNRIGLPHSFSIPYFLSPDFYVGFGWYRKHFNVPQSAAGKQIFIEFEAAFQVAEVFVNGKEMGVHRGGYTGFSIDITESLKLGGENLIAVRVNNRWDARLAPRAGEHVFSGGIYRDVSLVITNPVHVTWNGTYIRTPQVSRASATACIDIDVANARPVPTAVSVHTEIMDPSGRTVASVKSPVHSITGGSTITIRQSTPEIRNPKLWHPDTPRLYTAVTRVYEGDNAIDEYKTPFGIRRLEWTSDKGFFLNGEHLYLRGANVHQDQAGWGDAATNAAIYRDVKLIKDAGFNFIRGSHYPHDPAFSQACDELGLLLWSENAFWGIGGFKGDGYWDCSAYPPSRDDQPAFDANARQQLQEMIRIHRNHPSIIAWSMCNEPFFTERSVFPQMMNLLKALVEDSRQLDPTRPAAIGGAQRPLDEQRIDRIGDLAGYNGDGGTIAIFQNPGVPSMVSEYGSTTTDRPGKYEPGWGDLAKDAGEAIHQWRSGQAIWCGFDHGSIAGARFGKMGIVDYFRVPKQAWYWYRNANCDVPPPAWPKEGTPARVLLTADKSEQICSDGTDDVLLIITIVNADGTPISNSPPVELEVISGPGEFPTGSSICFEPTGDIRILDGVAAITFRSYYAGKTVIRATSSGLESSEVTLQFQGPVKYLPGVSPATKHRPYVRFKRADNSATPQEFGRNNPTFASTAAPGHPSGHAADGNPNTFWQPSIEDQQPTLVLDLEKFVAVSQVRLHFQQESRYRYRVEFSTDCENWRELLNRTANGQPERMHEFNIDGKLVGRFVRVSFHSVSGSGRAQLSDIRVVGTMVNK